MFKPNVMAGAIALALVLPAGAQTQSNPELDEIRKQVQELKESYESRIQALEKRLKEAEEGAAKAQSAATQAQQSATQAQQSTQAAAAPPPSQQASQNAFNPALSLILNGSYNNFSVNPANASVTGFLPAPLYGDVLGPRGFSLDESEFTASASVDPYFRGQFTAAFSEGAVSVEEAFFQTLALGHGLSLKGGRFFSSIGYENSIHAHAWDFKDPALVQTVFLGPNFSETGLQLNWIAPTPLFVELGTEIGAGATEPGLGLDTGFNRNGIPSWTVYAHIGDDIGTGGSYRVGASTLQTTTGNNAIPFGDLDQTTGTTNLFTGNVRLYGLDFVYKWAPDGNPVDRNFKFVAEWWYRQYAGNMDFDTTSTLGVGPVTEGFTAKQQGWYVQGVYQFVPEWRVGLRYDRLNEGSISTGPTGVAIGATVPNYTPWRAAAMVDWSLSEFSRIRLQVQQDRAQQGVIDNEVFVQYIMSLGAHGAHKF
jgi:outer membrane murein-binding lipoprotein Lpp